MTRKQVTTEICQTSLRKHHYKNITTKVTVIIERTQSESSFILKSHSKVVKNVSIPERNERRETSPQETRKSPICCSTHFTLDVAVTAVSSRGDVGADVGSARDILGGHADVGRDVDGGSVSVVDDEGLDSGLDGDQSGGGLDDGDVDIGGGVDLDALGVGQLVEVRGVLGGGALENIGVLKFLLSSG
jgi:hypothetical protein